MSEQVRTFMGIPVEGTIRHNGYITQRPAHEFEPLLRAVLADSNVVTFGWEQYTPYYNDGDPCVFRARTVWFQLTVNEHPLLKLTEYSYEVGDWVPCDIPVEWRETARRCNELSAAIESGAFDTVLLDAFGDHAEVRVTRDGITVTFYAHD